MAKIAADQVVYMEGHKLKMQQLDEEAAEQASNAQMQHNWEVQEHAREHAEQMARIEQERSQADT